MKEGARQYTAQYTAAGTEKLHRIATKPTKIVSKVHHNVRFVWRGAVGARLQEESDEKHHVLASSSLLLKNDLRLDY